MNTLTDLCSVGATFTSTVSTHDVFDCLFGPALADGLGVVSLWNDETRESTFHTTTIDAAEYALNRTPGNVYVGTCLRPPGLPSNKRGAADEVTALTCLWADIDVVGPSHKGTNYSPTYEAAHELASATGCEPTICVYTGGGLHAYWKLDKPWSLATVDDREAAKELTKGWHDHLAQLARDCGIVIDSTHDLARVLRVPGTRNLKPVFETPPIVAVVSCQPEAVFTIDQLTPERPEPEPGDEFFRQEQEQMQGACGPAPSCANLGDEALLDAARRANNGRKFRALFDDGDWKGQGYKSPSEADIALTAMLCFYTGCDASRVDRLFRRSALCRAADRQEKWDRVGTQTIDKAITFVAARGTGSARKADAGLPSFDGPLGLKLAATDAKSKGKQGKIELFFDVFVDSKDIAPLSVTTAESKISAFSRDLVSWVQADGRMLSQNDRARVRQFVGRVLNQAPKILAQADRHRAAHAQPKAPSMQQIIIDRAPKLAGLRFFNDDGSAWSEHKGGHAVKRADFCATVSNKLIQEVEKARDYPEDRRGNSAPITLLRTFLPVAWTECNLPREADVDTGPDSAAAGRYRRAIAALFRVHRLWCKRRDGTTEQGSLATLINKILKGSQPQGQWIPAPNGLAAWTRIDNQGQPWIGIRYELPGQFSGVDRIELPNTRSQDDLSKIAGRYGLTVDRDDDAASGRLGRGQGQQRICVLSRAMTDEILGLHDDSQDG